MAIFGEPPHDSCKDMKDSWAETCSGKIYDKEFDEPVLLFDVEQDPGEHDNLAAQHPDIVQRMLAEMTAFEQSLGEVPPTKR